MPVNATSVQARGPAACCGIYVRVSTAEQNCELQIREIQQHASIQGWQVIETYEDVASGSNDRRRALTQLMADARAGKFSIVLVWKLDRFGRSLVDCLNRIRELEELNIRFIAITQGLDTDQRNPGSRLLLHVLAAAAEFERSLIRERTQAGRLRYRQDFAAGRVGEAVHSKSGKDLPPHRPRKVFNRDRVLELRGQGMSIRAIARTMRLGLGTVSRTLEERSKSIRDQMDGGSVHSC